MYIGQQKKGQREFGDKSHQLGGNMAEKKYLNFSQLNQVFNFLRLAALNNRLHLSESWCSHLSNEKNGL